jgi:drug/metabolite transporter (DMT)-like permease
MNKDFLRAYLAAMLTVMLWAMSYIWSDRLLELAIPVEFFVPVRLCIAGILLFALNSFLGQDMRMRRQDVLKFVILSLCMPFVYFVAETYGLQFTESPTITSLIVATNPLFAMAVGLLIFKENFTRINILGVVITLAGLWRVTFSRTETGPMFWVGIGILFIAVISEVSQISVTKHLSARYTPSVIVMYQFLFGAVLFMPLFFTKGLHGFDAARYLSWESLYPIIALALFCSATAFTSWAYAIRKLGVAHTSVFLAVVPLVTAVLSFLFGEERLSALQWAGLAVAMVGIYLTQLPPKKPTCKA